MKSKYEIMAVVKRISIMHERKINSNFIKVIMSFVLVLLFFVGTYVLYVQKQVEEKERRMLLLLLSQAYHENHQEKMAEIYRHKAEEELLKMKEVRMANPLFDE